MDAVVTTIRFSVITNAEKIDDARKAVRESIIPDCLIGIVNGDERQFVYVNDSGRFESITTPNILDDTKTLDYVSNVINKRNENIPAPFVRGVIATTWFLPYPNATISSSIDKFYEDYVGADVDLHKYFPESALSDFDDISVTSELEQMSLSNVNRLITAIIEKSHFAVEFQGDKLISIDGEKPESLFDYLSSSSYWDYSYFITAIK